MGLGVHCSLSGVGCGAGCPVRPLGGGLWGTVHTEVFVLMDPGGHCSDQQQNPIARYHKAVAPLQEASLCVCVIHNSLTMAGMCDGHCWFLLLLIL